MTDVCYIETRTQVYWVKIQHLNQSLLQELYNKWYGTTTRHLYNGHFPGQSGSAGTRMSPFWILLELRMTEVVVTTGAIRRAKPQSNHHHQQTNTQLFTARIPFLLPNQH